MGDSVSINIDGRSLSVPAGINVIEAAELAGVEIPHFCYHPNLKVAGSCRMCLVSVGTPARDRATGAPVLNDDGTQKIAFMPKLAIACGTRVSEGMHIVTDSEQVRSAREGVIEFILANHPLDCPICDKAGECRLQEYSAKYGSGVCRYVEDKNVKPKRVEIGGGRVVLDAERCILCSRCIRICREVVGRDILQFTKRGSKNEIAVYGDDGRDSNYLLNIVDSCPVGALTETAFRFRMRTWFLRPTDGISAESSAGVNTRVWSREGEVYRITPRANPEVNDAWMTDSGRSEYRFMNCDSRFTAMRVDGAPCDAHYAVARAAEIFGMGGGLAIVASGRQTLEEQFMTSELARISGARVYAAAHLGEDDGFLLSCDRTPNMRGLFISGLISEYPGRDLGALSRDIRDGSVKSVISFGEDLIALGLEERDFKLANIIYCGSRDNPTARLAKVAVACPSVFEKSGLFVNRQFRLQKFEKAVEAPEGVEDEIAVLTRLINALGTSSYSVPEIGEVRKVMAAACPILPEGCAVGRGGVLLDPSKFSGIDFPEANALHFDKNE